MMVLGRGMGPVLKGDEAIDVTAASPPMHSWTRSIPSASTPLAGVEMVEAFCECLVPQEVVIPTSEYRAWARCGRTLAIFCINCRRDISLEEAMATTP